jgi:thiol:disulfide interchange protein DsbD
MLDFYADWCISCKEMEKFTFTDARVAQRMDRMLLLQADVTANSEADKALLKRFGLFGPPGIIFFDEGGAEMDGLRVVGYQAADKFLHTLDRVVTN